jgi:hypothetical protein
VLQIFRYKRGIVDLCPAQHVGTLLPTSEWLRAGPQLIHVQSRGVRSYVIHELISRSSSSDRFSRFSGVHQRRGGDTEPQHSAQKEMCSIEACYTCSLSEVQKREQIWCDFVNFRRPEIPPHVRGTSSTIQVLIQNRNARVFQRVAAVSLLLAPRAFSLLSSFHSGRSP